jgi:hypothetical protein
MSDRHQHFFTTLLFASGIFAASTALGAPLLTAITQSFGTSIDQQVIDTEASGTASANLVDARTASQALAQFGVLRASGQAEEIDALPLRNTSAAAVASWSDDVTLDAAGLTGQPGTATVEYRIDGSMSFESAANARSNYSFFVRRGALFEHVSVGNWQIGIGPSGADFMNQILFATFPIVFGAERQWTFTISLQSNVLGLVRGSSATVDMSDTALWLGISEVRDAAGNLVPTYDLTSASSTDWSQSVLHAVPEPSTLILFCMGAVGVCGALRKRKERMLPMVDSSR